MSDEHEAIDVYVLEGYASAIGTFWAEALVVSLRWHAFGDPRVHSLTLFAVGTRPDHSFSCAKRLDPHARFFFLQG